MVLPILLALEPAGQFIPSGQVSHLPDAARKVPSWQMQAEIDFEAQERVVVRAGHLVHDPAPSESE
jgi:hypothetical protein